MKQYQKPEFIVSAIGTNETIASGSPLFTDKGTYTDDDGVTVTVYEIQSFTEGSN